MFEAGVLILGKSLYHHFFMQFECEFESELAAYLMILVCFSQAFSAFDLTINIDWSIHLW